MAAFSIWQGDMHMSGKMPKKFIDKMLEIANRDPVGTWDYRGMELMTAAIKEVKAEQSKS